MITGSPDERLDYSDMCIAHLEQQLTACQKELAEANNIIIAMKQQLVEANRIPKLTQSRIAELVGNCKELIRQRDELKDELDEARAKIEKLKSVQYFPVWKLPDNGPILYCMEKIELCECTGRLHKLSFGCS